MSAQRFLLSFALACALQSMFACSFDRSANDAHGCTEECSVCHLGYCLVTRQEAANGSGGGGATSGNAGTNGGGGGGGSGAGGAGAVSGAGAGAGAGGAGEGGAGAGGAGCVPAPEVCNGVDDDCNGAIDESTDMPCYPGGVAGCALGTSGDLECTGACAAGMQRCEGGVLRECTGFAGPVKEACGAAPAIDDDCDGAIDDGCECDAGETQECYSAPDRTAGVGPCRKGTQTCEGGEFGACVGEVTPVPETCSSSGVDDNCDRVRDNVPMRGSICFDFTQRGICLAGTFMCQGASLQCVTPTPTSNEAECDGFDDDCDGSVDEDFPLNRDEDNCGSCGVRCSDGQRCCGGMCRTVETDEAHCGECNNDCDGLTCCNGDCVAMDSHDHCGGCNIKCAANEECCDSACTPVDTSEHCGGCSTACGNNQECCDGLCSNMRPGGRCGDCDMPCGIGQTCCDGACVTTSDDDNNCGGCGMVCPDACPFCSMNECRDSSGLVCI